MLERITRRAPRARRAGLLVIGLILGGAFLVPPRAGAQAAPMPPAALLVSRAVANAQTSGRVVLVEFGASWCVWCTHFQAFIHDPAIAPIVERNFVVLTLVVHEREDKTALEHPGADARMTEWGGATAGLPFYVFLDGTGRRIGNSNAMADGSNIGFPATPEEIARFADLMARVAPRFTAADRAAVVRYLEAKSRQS